MNLVKRLSIALFALVFVSMVGCTSTTPRESTGEYVSDAWITTKVKAALAEDSQVKATEVNVETYKGTVQLTGFVSSASAIDQAVRVTRGIKGVTSVKNDMLVK